MNTQSPEQPEFSPSPQIVEIEVPNDGAIFFYKAGVRAGLEAMEQGKRLFVLAGDEATVAKIADAINALTSFLEAVREVEGDIIQGLHAPQATQVDAGFAPHTEDESTM